MSKQRIVDTRIWNDSYFADLDPSEKLLFIYFLTNQYLDLCGIYEVPLKMVAMETGLDKEMVIKILLRFKKDQKVFYSDGWIFIKNFTKYQNFSNPKIELGIKRSLNAIPVKVLESLSKISGIKELSISYPYPMDRISHLYLYLTCTCTPTLPSDMSPSATTSTFSDDQNHQKKGAIFMDEEDFDKFWEIWPGRGKGNGDPKKPTKNKFLKLEKSLLPRILENVSELAKTKNAGTEYFPTALTYVSQERWGDENKMVHQSLEQEVKSLIAEYPGNAWKASNVFKERHKDMDINGPLKPYMLMFPLE